MNVIYIHIFLNWSMVLQICASALHIRDCVGVNMTAIFLSIYLGIIINYSWYIDIFA